MIGYIYDMTNKLWFNYLFI